MKVLEQVRHPNIILLLGVVIEKPNAIGIVMEYMGKQSLKCVLENPAIGISLSQKLVIAIQIAQAMYYLHACNPPIVHRDLKTSNCLVDEHLNVKLCDFGYLLPPSLTSRQHSENPQGPAELLDKDSQHVPVYGARNYEHVGVHGPIRRVRLWSAAVGTVDAQGCLRQTSADPGDLHGCQRGESKSYITYGRTNDRWCHTTATRTTRA